MYLFYAWVWAEGLAFAQCWHVALGVVSLSVLVAFVALKYYDEPVRAWLSSRSSRKYSVAAPSKSV